MARYTMWVKTLKDNNFDFGLTDYPIFDETYRATLNQKIINHYYMYEIGSETPEMFKFFLNTKMGEIMPYYNSLYLSIPKTFDSNTFNDIIEYLGQTQNETTNSGMDSQSGTNSNTDNIGESTTTYNKGSQTNTNNQYNFDTPQNLNSLNLNDPDHMSSAFSNTAILGSTIDSDNRSSQINTSNGSNSNTTTYGHIINNVESFINRKNIHSGYNQSIYKTMLEFRQAILNIDMMIINDLRSLFMLIY